jgi:hypothetical protein
VSAVSSPRCVAHQADPEEALLGVAEGHLGLGCSRVVAFRKRGIECVSDPGMTWWAVVQTMFVGMVQYVSCARVGDD